MSKASDIHQSAETAVLVYINLDNAEDSFAEDEFEGLCEAAGVVPAASIRQRLDRPYAKTLIGSGKAEEAAALVKEVRADILLVDGEVNAVQQRNLQEITGTRVVDRTQLILDIFARRARTKEGMLQVELAQLSTMMPKLMAVYTKFERQKGGIGLRGPGETKLESDRRLVRDRIARLKEEIDDVRRIRHQQRQSRRKHPFPFASLVGYTSAGKSTLMNRLAETDLLADAMPFATLDPTTRRIDLPEGYAVFLTDTVGFIRNLPTHLVAAFRATLEEVTEADILIHVVDVSHPDWETQADAVIDTIKLLGAQDKPIVTVFNKIDLVEDKSMLTRLVADMPNSAAISASSGRGMNDLMDVLIGQVKGLLGRICAIVPYAESGLIQECYDFGRVFRVDYRDDGIHLEAELVEAMRKKLAPYVVK